MIKFIITHSIEFIVGLVLITQVVIPIFIENLPLFWLFRPKKKKIK